MVGYLSGFGITKLLDEDESMTQTQTLAIIGDMAPGKNAPYFALCYINDIDFYTVNTEIDQIIRRYEREGMVSREGDVYSYGILLMETFTKKKSTDEILMEAMNLRYWVSDSIFNHSIIEVGENDLQQIEDEYFSAREQWVSSVIYQKCCKYIDKN
ncbi:hypothetical protein Ddye_000588 [Dipteronia dyeriana]|uniref:Protein kinase domain-containing protein n=1 Tax=Dipteronia dyeriana TaxID=168575 RepID=A0AAD9XLZ6_9ROSI|nr:hypothetical protein Ddye_000588 [Dipteronia dyeriana]